MAKNALKPTSDIEVTINDEAVPEFDSVSDTTQVQLPDGSVTITIGPPAALPKKTKDFGDNLAELLDNAELGALAEKILLGIEQDIQSRHNWLENMSRGISLLGLEMKSPAGAATTGASPAEGTSTVDHPLLLEAVLRFQANARGELLPADGPVKVRNDGEPGTLGDRLAEALEKDMNHYLTKVAKEYYPDTDRMLLLTGFSGIGFKKGYHCPIKRRPVIQSINAQDLIVSNAATDIDNSGRITHRIRMGPSTMKRMQLLGAYKDIRLSTPGTPTLRDPVEQKIDQVQGIAPATYIEPSDQDRELYECYCEIEVPGFEHEIDGDKTGLPLPYKVTIDRDDRTILEIRRNWEEDDTFCLPRNRIVAYVFIPGLGFYGIGLLNILGNATKAVTAAWRLMIDAGMFSNFPGFLYIKSLAKQLTNQFRVPPGGGMPIDTTGADIRSSIMPLPYKDPSAVFIQLIENVVSTAQRVGGTAEMQVGEGKQDAPVGTTLAMVEQATKLMSAVHKRMHQAQGAEFDMLKQMLMEDPSALWRHNKKSKVLSMLIKEAGQQSVVDQEQSAEDRHNALFLAALADVELIPRADPNTSSQTERYLKVVAMRQMAMTPNSNLDLNKIDEHAFYVMGVNDYESFLKPPPDPNAPPPPPPPEQLTAMATIMAAQARIKEAQTKETQATQESQKSAAELASDIQLKQAEMASKEKIASLGVARELVIHNEDAQAAKQELGLQQGNDHQDRIAQTQSEDANRAHEASLAMAQRNHDAQQAQADRAHEATQGVAERVHDSNQIGLGLVHEGIQNNVERQHAAIQDNESRQQEYRQEGLARIHEHQQSELDRQHEQEQNELDRQAQIKAAAAKPKPTVSSAKPKGKKK